MNDDVAVRLPADALGAHALPVAKSQVYYLAFRRSHGLELDRAAPLHRFLCLPLCHPLDARTAAALVAFGIDFQLLAGIRIGVEDDARQMFDRIQRLAPAANEYPQLLAGDLRPERVRRLLYGDPCVDTQVAQDGVEVLPQPVRARTRLPIVLVAQSLFFVARGYPAEGFESVLAEDDFHLRVDAAYSQEAFLRLGQHP